MLRWNDLPDVPAGFGPSAVTVGLFDGVHRGHASVVGLAVQRARSRQIPTVVVTFDPNPIAVLRPDVAPLALASLDHRLALFAGLGVDAALVLPFTRELAAQSPEQFVDQVLVAALAARLVVVGADFRFGHRAAGDVALLTRLGQARGFDVEAAPLAGDHGERWSSTWVRRDVAAGDVEGAAAVLGRPHRIEGVVVVGDRRGRTIGYPTANLEVAPGSAVPADGVYAGWLVRSDGGRLPAAISIGTNPTFDGVGRRVEAYVLDRDDLELYGERLALDFAARLRETVRFDGVEPLLEQMAADVERTRVLTAGMWAT